MTKNNGGFLFTAQWETPGSLSLEPLLQGLEALKKGGEVVHILEGEGGLSPLVAAAKARKMGLKPVVHVQCRDRNRRALFSDLATLAALGVKEVVISTGGHSPQLAPAKPVYDLDVIQILQMMQDMGRGRDLAGRPLAGSFSVSPGVVVNLRGEPELEKLSLRKKMDMGAAFALLTPSTRLEEIEAVASWVSLPTIASVKLEEANSQEIVAMARPLMNGGVRGLNLIVGSGQEGRGAEVLAQMRRSLS